jgi:hypothetical protein
MVKLYGTSDSDYLEVKVLKDPIAREIQYVDINHIPFSDRDLAIDMGGARELDLDVGCVSESEREALVDFVFHKLARITFDDVKYMTAKYIGGNRNWPVTVITKLHNFTLSLRVSSLLLSFAEKTEPGADVCSNAGNYEAEAEFTITVGASAGKTSFTISDGTRVLQYIGVALVASDVIVINNWNAYLNGNEITKNLSGEFSLIPKNQSTFKFTFVDITTGEVSIKYRDTWR